MDEIQKLAAIAALNKMIKDGSISICTVDNILKMTGGMPHSRDYEVLHMLHCVKFSDMPPELLKELPEIIQRVVGAAGVEWKFNIGPEYRSLMISEVKA